MTRFHLTTAAKIFGIFSTLLILDGFFGAAIDSLRSTFATGPAVLAKNLAEEDQQKREWIGDSDLPPLPTAPLEPCPDLSAMPSFIRSAQERAWLYMFIAPVKAFCVHDFGPRRSFYYTSASEFLRNSANSDLPEFWCRSLFLPRSMFFARNNGAAGELDSLGRQLFGGENFAVLKSGVFLHNSGDTCRMEKYGLIFRMVGGVDGADVRATRFAVTRDSRDHYIGTLWVNTRRQSWGKFLNLEYLRRLYLTMALQAAYVVACGTVIVLAMRRIQIAIVTYPRGMPKTTMPDWLDFLLMLAWAASRDDELYHVEELAERYEIRYGRRKGGNWAYLWQVLDALAFKTCRRATRPFKLVIKEVRFRRFTTR
jgi:hypothetical protein